jgi:hypothetical protein
MYIAKIFFMKLYRGDQKALDKVGYKANCAEDLTANQKCRIKIRAIGIDYENVTKWLETADSLEAIALINALSENKSLDSAQLQRARDFTAELRKRLVETKTDKMLIRHINQHL